MPTAISGLSCLVINSANDSKPVFMSWNLNDVRTTGSDFLTEQLIILWKEITFVISERIAVVY